ncbi:non-specific protein-tyrosine kinase [Exophiala viscosa]|uniref:Non-specific protein-tyrosine kinase n=1 Tax=Exophiala viscosa TaxID=2486360 RepID=A0AAN6DRX4_9EURO|nr:non-specific protein-tyrosine kinase [Exophiala viscosa]
MLNSLLGLAKQKNIRSFAEYGEDLEQKYNCTKLGEGGYGEVFETKSKDPDSATDIERDQGVVLKIVPFSPEEEHSLDYDTAQLPAVIREAQLSLQLDSLHGFVRCRGISVVSGKYPDILLDAFHTFRDEHPEDTENDDPDGFPEDQTFVIIEMNHAGRSIAKIKTPSAFQAFDIFWQTVIILANAEEKLEFEHRDLHIGNICFKPQVRDGPTDLDVERITDPGNDPEVALGLSNLQVTIIDYTLARAKIGEEVLFDPIADWEEDRLNTGPEIDLLQFATYRKVRDWAKEVQAEVLANVEGTEVDKYARFLPKTNVVWLSYLVRALLLRRGLAKSTTLGNDSQSAAGRLQSLLWSGLEAVAEIVGKAFPLIPESAAGLLETALSSGWLTTADVEAFRARMEEL